MVVGLSGDLGCNGLGFVVVCWVWNWLKMMMVSVWLFLGLVLLMMMVEERGISGFGICCF